MFSMTCLVNLYCVCISTTFDTSNNIPLSSENVTTNEGNNNEEKRSDIDIISQKDPESTVEKSNIMTQTTIEIATVIVITNNINTTPVTLELRPSRDRTN